MKPKSGGHSLMARIQNGHRKGKTRCVCLNNLRGTKWPGPLPIKVIKRHLNTIGEDLPNRPSLSPSRAV